MINHKITGSAEDASFGEFFKKTHRAIVTRAARLASEASAGKTINGTSPLHGQIDVGSWGEGTRVASIFPYR
jgi:hypothetical protein